jgi:hypothetical protein
MPLTEALQLEMPADSPIQVNRFILQNAYPVCTNFSLE